MPSVFMKDLIKVYRTGKSEVIALRGLDTTLADGELVPLQGPSGCGKTTLLLVDEPTGELDTKKGRDILELFGRLNRDLKKTIMVVTHDQRVASIAHRVL